MILSLADVTYFVHGGFEALSNGRLLSWRAEAMTSNGLTPVASWSFFTGPADTTRAEMDELDADLMDVHPLLTDVWGSFIYIKSATLSEPFRGQGLGPILSGLLIEHFTAASDYGILACHASPTHGPASETRDDAHYEAIVKIRRTWEKLGLQRADHNSALLFTSLQSATASLKLSELLAAYVA